MQTTPLLCITTNYHRELTKRIKKNTNINMIWVKVDILVHPCQLLGYHWGRHSVIVMMTDKLNFESSF